MDLTEELISQAAVQVTGSVKVAYQGQALDFSPPWKRIPMAEAIRGAIKGLSDKDISDPDRLRHELLRQAPKQEVAAIEQMRPGELVGALFEKYVEHSLVQPTFVTEFPLELSPLARKNDARPEMTDRFELFVAGREIANAFSELNDPLDQKERFLAQVEARQRGQTETMDYDEDYIRALEHGMPPAAGEGIGIDRLTMLFTDAASIRDVILFPLLKPIAK
jgi:lysyl-tRNA synthetase class 2